MQIGAIAAATGASPKAIRLYEQMGLLPPVRRHGAYRSYSAEDVQLVRWIRQAQRLGFRLSELGALRSEIGSPDWARIGIMLEAKRVHVAAEIQRLASIEQQLAELADELGTCDSLGAPAAACDG